MSLIVINGVEIQANKKGYFHIQSEVRKILARNNFI